MKKRYIFLIIALVFGSFICFLHPSFHAFRDWILFLVIFSITAFVLAAQVGNRPRKFREQEEVLDFLQEGVVILNSKGIILKINLKAAHIFNGKKEEFLGKFLFSLDFLESQMEIWRRCHDTKSTESLTFFLDSEKKNCCDVVLKPFGQSSGKFILTLRDSFREYQKHQLGKDFVANASHELRTPITIIKGFAETIYDLPEISGSMLQEFTEKIMRNCQRMDSLVKNLLILADLDYLPAVHFQECDVVALLDNCSHTLLSLYPKIRIEVLKNIDIITIPADPDLLELALMNLLENAVKYSSQTALINITIEDSKDRVYLKIADSGAGIAKEDLDHIFERFYTVDKTHSRKLGGAGLGLSIVKSIISKHDGVIEAQSRYGQGTEFSLTFNKINQSVL